MSKTNKLDQIHRFIFDDADIRGEIVSLHKAYLNARQHQNLPEAIQVLLGEFLAAACLISKILKFEGTITVQARGDGPLPLIMAEATEKQSIRGIAKISENTPSESLDNLSLPQMIGRGVLTLTMDPQHGQRYQGIVELKGDTLAESLTNYFCQSEQLPTQLWLFATPEHAGGLLLQALPQEASPSLKSEDWNTATQLASTLTTSEMRELSHSDVLTRLFSEEYTVRMFEGSKPHFTCQCSLERCANTLIAIGKDEADSILDELGLIEINCEFCGKLYTFDEEQLSKIYQTHEAREKSQRQLH